MSAFILTPARSKLVNPSGGSNHHADNGADASFPSNLVKIRNSATKVCHSTEEYSSSPSSHTRQLNKYRMSLGSRRGGSLEHGEIGVFDAVKYFKAELDGRKKHGTKLAGILSHGANNNIDHSPKTHELKRVMGLFRGFSTCSCRKKSLDIDERATGKNSSSNNRGRIVDLRAHDFGQGNGNKPPKIGQIAVPPDSTTPLKRREETAPTNSIKQATLDFPVFNPATIRSIARGVVQQNKEKPRFSIEVFGSSPMVKMGMNPSKHRRLLMSSTDFGNQLGDHTNQGNTVRGAHADDDVASDSSSDLFEIHSLSRWQSSMNQKTNLDQFKLSFML